MICQDSIAQNSLVQRENPVAQNLSGEDLVAKHPVAEQLVAQKRVSEEFGVFAGGAVASRRVAVGQSGAKRPADVVAREAARGLVAGRWGASAAGIAAVVIGHAPQVTQITPGWSPVVLVVVQVRLEELNRFRRTFFGFRAFAFHRQIPDSCLRLSDVQRCFFQTVSR